MSTYQALLTINDNHSMRVNMPLATEIGLEESIVLLQLEYLISVSRHLKDGVLWTYQSIKKLREKYFRFWSESTICRILNRLEGKGLIKTGNFNTLKLDRTKWFALDPNGIRKLKTVSIKEVDVKYLPDNSNEEPILQNDKTILQNDKSFSSDCINHVVNLTSPCSQIEPTIPKTTTEKAPDPLLDPKEVMLHAAQESGANIKPPRPVERIIRSKHIERVTRCTEQRSRDIATVAAFWRKGHGYPDYRLVEGSATWLAVYDRLDEGYTIRDLKLASYGCKFDSFYMGKNDNKKKLDTLLNICKSPESVQKFIDLGNEHLAKANGEREEIDPAVERYFKGHEAVRLEKLKDRELASGQTGKS